MTAAPSIPDAAPALQRELTSAALRARPSASPWLLGPWLDAFLIANIAWPLLLLWQIGDGFSGREGLQFWQIYFVTTPHRWITLALVFLDRDRFSQRRLTFLAIAALAITACLSVRLATGTLTCLLTIDYLWNAWHFAAQHHGIYRIYQRRSEKVLGACGSRSEPQPSDVNFVDRLSLEKWSLRLFLLFVILRVAGATWSYTSFEQTLHAADWLVLAIPAWLIIRDLTQRVRSLPRTLYLLSVTILYTSMLAAVHANRPTLILSLATASAVFHATEYLALASWSARGRHSAHGSRLGLMSHLVPRWGLVLGSFLLVLGAGGWLLNEHLMQPWLFLNVIVAFLHYAYDGVIWRRKEGHS
jgi:hypothetical protein